MIYEQITVLIPVYNAERYLRETLATVSAQTLADFEILAIDDGSTDGSPEILAEYRTKEPRLRVIRQANGGISAALNAGIAAARGGLIARMDADDLMAPERLQRQRDFLLKHPELGFCASFLDLIDASGRSFGEYLPGPLDLADLAARMAREEPLTYTHPSVMYHTELARRLGGYDTRHEPCEDMELFGRMILAGFPGLVIPEKLLRYRVHGASISGAKAVSQVRKRERVRREFYARRAVAQGLRRDGGEARETPPGIPARLAAEARVRADACRQIALYRRAERRPWAALALTAVAGLLRPAAALRFMAGRIGGIMGRGQARNRHRPETAG